MDGTDYMSIFGPLKYNKHLQAVKHILKYVKGASKYGLMYTKGKDSKLTGYILTATLPGMLMMEGAQGRYILSQ